MPEESIVTGKKIAEWSLGSIVGNLAWLAMIVGAPTLLGYFNGSIIGVWEFAREHAAEAVACCLALLLLGSLIGAIARHRIAAKQLAAKDARIKELEDRLAHEQRKSASAESNPLGLSKAANAKYNLMEECDIKAFKNLCATSVFDDSHKPFHPLIFDLDDQKLGAVSLTRFALKRLSSIGIIEINLKRDVATVNDPEAPFRQILPGVKAEGIDVILSLHDGDFRIEGGCMAFFARAGCLASNDLHCADLGVVDFTPFGKEIAGAIDIPALGSLRQYIEHSYKITRQAESPIGGWGNQGS